jgi:regulator of protease activity HflC (stomatin/prohibitin superfamily)
MLIAVLGIIILIVGIVLKRSPEPGSHFAGIVRTVGIVVVVLGLLLSSVKVIDRGEVGVQVLFGKVQNEVLESGLHLLTLPRK